MRRSVSVGGVVTAVLILLGLDTSVTTTGMGAALMAPTFATGGEGIVGGRVMPVEFATLLVQLCDVARWSEGGLSAGPICEAGVPVRF